MNIFKSLKRALLGWSTPDFYKEHLTEMQNTNYSLLKTATLFSAGMCTFLFILTLVNPMIEELSSFYLFFTMFFGVMALLVLLLVNKRRKLIPVFFYTFAASIFILVTIVGTHFSPEIPAVTFYVFLMIIPILFVTRPIYSVGLSITATVVFCIVTVLYKGADSYFAQTDVLNAFCCCVVGIGFDITIVNLYLENIKSKTLFKHQSTTDQLTSLPNRRSFDIYCHTLLNKPRKDTDTIYCFMMDIDGFKSYNDTYGHVQGDACLCQVSRALELAANVHNVFLARFGGEEFVAVFVPHTKHEATNVAQRFVDCVQDLQIEHRCMPEKRITISVGYANSQDCETTDIHALIGFADSALYNAKMSGKNQICLWKKEKET